MNKLTGLIDSITKGKVKTGPNIGKAFYIVTLDGGQKLYAWTFDAIRNIKAGNEAEFSLETKGKYTHIVDSLPITNVNAETENPIEPEPIGDEDIPDAPTFTPKATNAKNNDEVISRQSALKSACSVSVGCDYDEEKLVAMAKRFYLYITEGM